MKENIIRSIELGIALAAGYMGAITALQTTLYAKILGKIEASFLGEFLKPYIPYFDIAVIIAVLFIVSNLWRRGDNENYAKIFSLNMLLFFSAVLDFSSFNWIGLIFNLTPQPKVSSTWVFAVGLLLQVTYLLLRYTVRFRYTREELQNRGATEEDIEQVSRGQMGYLTMLVLATMGLTAGIYFAVPFIGQALSQPLRGIPVPHVFIGFIVVMGISAALISYLRGAVSLQTPQQEEIEESLDPI